MGYKRYLYLRNKDRDLADELQSHLAHEEDAYVARGLPDAEARRRARLSLGNPPVVRKRIWSYRSVLIIDDLWRDLRFACRSLRKSPGSNMVALLVIELGIGVNTAVLSVINTVLLEPLPYSDPHSLVRFVLFTPQRTLDGASVPECNRRAQPFAKLQALTQVEPD